MVKFIDGGVTAPAGFIASGIHCGARKNKDKLDLAMIYSACRCTAAAAYTTNLVKGSPIRVTREHLADGAARCMICNSGNANTCTTDGYERATEVTEAVASALGIDADDVIVASTGVIGQHLDTAPIVAGIPRLVSQLLPSGGELAAEAIMTTDTKRKCCAVEFTVDGRVCRLGGIAKGSGMIEPNMATMLCFLTSDIAIESGLLHEALIRTVNKTFNRISIDGDTSTNDMVSIMCNGMAENTELTASCEGLEAFEEALTALCTRLSREIASDGEGADKLIECTVSGVCCEEKAVRLGKSVINSSLFKTMIFGSDANWGRVLCALGYAGEQIDVEAVDVTFASAKGELLVCHDGVEVVFDEDKAKEILLEDEVKVLIAFREGEASATVWGCDLTYDYVRINGDYRS